MSTAGSTMTPPTPAPAAGTGPRSSPLGRMKALARAEMTLLVRNKAMLVTALVVPVGLMVSVRATTKDMDLPAGMSVGLLMVTGALGFVLLFGVYSNLAGVYTTRREELVLKRLRTGEARDAEILTGAALPSVVLALVQCVVLAVGGAVLLDLAAPETPLTAALGLLLGLVVAVALGAWTSSWTKSAEAAQITPLPLMMVTLALSGMFVPLEVLPDTVADVCRFLPFTPVMDLVRDGWSGTMDGVEVLRAAAVALAWTGLAVWGVQRRFRWEPRR